MQSAKPCNALGTGPEHQVIGVAKYDIRARSMHLCRAHCLYGRSRADRHESRCPNVAAQHGDRASARFAVGGGDREGESARHGSAHKHYIENWETVSRKAIHCYTGCMTILEKFRHFAANLPADRLNSVEVALAEIMESYSDHYCFSASELQTIDQRFGETKPEFSNGDDIAELFGKPFSV